MLTPLRLLALTGSRGADSGVIQASIGKIEVRKYRGIERIESPISSRAWRATTDAFLCSARKRLLHSRKFPAPNSNTLGFAIPKQSQGEMSIPYSPGWLKTWTYASHKSTKVPEAAVCTMRAAPPIRTRRGSLNLRSNLYLAEGYHIRPSTPIARVACTV